MGILRRRFAYPGIYYWNGASNNNNSIVTSNNNNDDDYNYNYNSNNNYRNCRRHRSRLIPSITLVVATGYLPHTGTHCAFEVFELTELSEKFC